jgi:diguanylate cyclase (GGDEF)-like protein
MAGRVRVLAVGRKPFQAAVAALLTGADVDGVDDPMSAIWQAGQAYYDAVVVSLSAGRDAAPAVRGLRKVYPHARLILAATPVHEPRARTALRDGADDYILEPLVRDELEQALHRSAASIEGAPRGVAAPRSGPSAEELAALGEILRTLGDGPEATLKRLADLLRRVFEAQGVSIDVGGLRAVAGESSAAVLEEPVLQGGMPAGAVRLGPRIGGAYEAMHVARLSEYAPLIEACIAQASAQQRWRTLALTDDVTGLHNRRHFDQMLEHLLAEAARDKLRVTVILFDLDDFKTYNDRFGHAVGDALLREMGVLLRRCSRETDLVARYGGDEFAVVFWEAERPRVAGSQHPCDAHVMAERFGPVIGEHRFQCLGADAPGPVTISAGLACFPWDGQTRAELLGAADAALRAAKRSGKCRILLAPGSASATAEGR